MSEGRESMSEAKYFHDRTNETCIVENLMCPPVAQLVEREAYTFVVLGSSPSGRTQEIFNRYTFVVLGSSPSGRTQ